MRIETNLKNMSDNLKDHVDEQRSDFNKVFEKLDSLNSKFAGKWVEKVSIGVLVSLIAGIALYLITLT